jgi:hypothetical protein
VLRHFVEVHNAKQQNVEIQISKQQNDKIQIANFKM